MNSSNLYGGIEAGGTKFNCIIASNTDTILARQSFPTTSPAETIGRVLKFFTDTPSNNGQLAGLGIASFGPVDRRVGSPTYGYITSTPKVAWSNTNLLGQLQDSLNIPVEFDTDVNGAALGEGALGAARGLDNYVYVTVGTGVGAGVVANGSPVNGATHLEVGHILTPRDPAEGRFKGTCPYHGDCLEGLVSGPALKARWGRPATELPPDHEAWEIQARYLAKMCINLTMCYSPERIILGGGVMQQSHLFPKIHTHFQTLMNGYQGGPSARAMKNFIVPTALDGMAGELGALLMAQRAALSNAARSSCHAPSLLKP